MTIEAIYRLDPAPAIQRLLATPVLDLPMQALSMAGEGWVLALIALALALKVNGDRVTALRSALRCVAVLVVTGLIVQATKRIVDAPRPLQFLGEPRVRVLLEPLRQWSFPSGHSAAVAGMALWASREPSAGRRLWPWLFAFGVGLSRVYVGAHWVTDVLTGWLLGLAVSAIVLRAWPVRRPAVAAPTATDGLPTAPKASEVDTCR